VKKFLAPIETRTADRPIAMPTQPSRLYDSEVSDRLFKTHSAAGRHLARSCSADGQRERLSLLQRYGEIYDVTAQVRYTQHAGHGWCASPPHSVFSPSPPLPTLKIYCNLPPSFKMTANLAKKLQSTDDQPAAISVLCVHTTLITQ